MDERTRLAIDWLLLSEEPAIRPMPRRDLLERRACCCSGVGVVGGYEACCARLQDAIPAWSAVRVTEHVGIRLRLRGGVMGLVLRGT